MNLSSDINKDLNTVKDLISNCSRPLIFFDDDCDGASSFIQIYNFLGDGKGVCVKGKPEVEAKYLRKVNEYSPDIVLVLDKPLVEDDFFSNISQKKIWVDHHPVQSHRNIYYLNPKKYSQEDNTPTSYWSYLLTDKKCLWLAMVGCLGDWSLVLKDEFIQKYPDLLEDTDDPSKALFDSKIGFLCKIVNFNMKGSARDVMKSIKVLTRISSPYEILNQTSSKGKYIYKKFNKINTEFEELKKNVVVDNNSSFLIYKYDNSSIAISSELSNEILFENKDKIIIVARENNERVIMSLRSATKKILEPLKQALNIVNGQGGGHDFACGASVDKKSFDLFLDSFKSYFT